MVSKNVINFYWQYLSKRLMILSELGMFIYYNDKVFQWYVGHFKRNWGKKRNSFHLYTNTSGCNRLNTQTRKLQKIEVRDLKGANLLHASKQRLFGLVFSSCLYFDQKLGWGVHNRPDSFPFHHVFPLK